MNCFPHTYEHAFRFYEHVVEKIRKDPNINPNVRQNSHDFSFPISDSFKRPSLFWMTGMVF